MNTEIKNQWITALRSGDYQQGIYNLFNGESFCCLGVLCDLAVKAQVLSEPRKLYYPLEDVDKYYYDNVWDSLPESVRIWAGLEISDPKINVSGPLRISYLNDELGYNFEHLATLIEEQL